MEPVLSAAGFGSAEEVRMALASRRAAPAGGMSISESSSEAAKMDKGEKPQRHGGTEEDPKLEIGDLKSAQPAAEESRYEPELPPEGYCAAAEVSTTEERGVQSSRAKGQGPEMPAGMRPRMPAGMPAPLLTAEETVRRLRVALGELAALALERRVLRALMGMWEMRRAQGNRPSGFINEGTPTGD